MLETERIASTDGVTVRAELRPGDLGAITRMHGSVYSAEHGMGPRFEAGVAETLGRAVNAGWPAAGGVRIVELRGGHAGSVGWTDEGDHAKVRWVLLDARLRGRGLGRRLLEELLGEIAAAGHELIELDTFSDLRAAGHLYRSLGFVAVSSRPFSDWGPTIEMQRYELRR